MLPHALSVFGEYKNTESMWREVAPLTVSVFLESVNSLLDTSDAADDYRFGVFGGCKEIRKGQGLTTKTTKSIKLRVFVRSVEKDGRFSVKFRFFP